MTLPWVLALWAASWAMAWLMWWLTMARLKRWVITVAQVFYHRGDDEND